jgi:hypothetical protein
VVAVKYITTGTDADSGKVTPLLLCYHPRSSQGTECQLQSGKEGDTALSGEGSQYGIGIRASDHMVVIITARIRWRATSTREQ